MLQADIPFLVPGESTILRESGDLVTTTVSSCQILALDLDSPECPTASAASRTAVAAASIYPRESLFRIPLTRHIPVPLANHPVASLDQNVAAEVEVLTLPLKSVNSRQAGCLPASQGVKILFHGLQVPLSGPCGREMPGCGL